MLKHEMLVNKSIPNDLWLKAKIALRKRIPSCRNDGWIMGRAVKRTARISGFDCQKIEHMLQRTSHHGKSSRCDAMSRAKVLRVEKFHNVKLWGDYKGAHAPRFAG